MMKLNKSAKLGLWDETSTGMICRKWLHVTAANTTKHGRLLLYDRQTGQGCV